MYTLLVISDSDKHFSSAIAEYIKRLGNTLRVISLKPIRHDNPSIIIQKETDLILERLAKNDNNSRGQTLILSPLGKNLSTLERKKALEKDDHTTLVIGGPFGLDYTRLSGIHISLGAQTMPHGLATLVMLEQLYRVETLKIGKTYHY